MNGVVPNCKFCVTMIFLKRVFIAKLLDISMFVGFRIFEMTMVILPG